MTCYISDNQNHKGAYVLNNKKVTEKLMATRKSISTHAEGNSSEIKQDVRDCKKEDKQTKFVPIYKLFSFADSTDIILMTLGVAGALANGATMPLLTVIIGSLINSFAEDQDIDQMVHRVSKVCLSIVYLAIGAGFTSFFQVTCWMVTGERQSARIRNLYLRALLKQEIAFFDKEGNTGEIVGRMSGDTILVQDAMGEKVGKFIGQTSTFFTGFVVAFAQGWLLTLVMISTIPIIGLCSVIISKVTIKMASRGQKTNIETSAIVQQTISSIRTVASFTGENLSVKDFKKALKNAYKSSINEGIVVGIGSGILTFLSYCALALGFWYGAKLILQGGYNGGKVISIILSVLYGSSSLAQVSPCMAAFAAGQAAAYKMFETINRKPEIDATDPTGKRLDVILGSIEFKDVHFSYPSRPEQKIFTGLSLFIHHGITVALVGGSGSGKSTVVSLIERFYDPQDGVVLIDGINIKQFQLRWLREKIGLVSQEPILFGSTIGDNITYGKNNATIEEIKAATELANASKFINMMPQGLDTMVGEQGTQLSGGQKQRIAIARAILKDPRILLLDEATSALDVESERVVQEALDRVMINRTTVIIAHRLSTVKTADTIAVMHQGSIVEQGSHIELQKNPMGAYSQFIQLQEMDQSLNQSSHAHQVEAILPAIEASSLSRNSSLERSIRRESSLICTESVLPVAVNCHESTSGEPKADFPSKKYKLVSIRRLAYLNKPEALILFLGSVAAFFNGIIYPAYAILITAMVRTFYEPPHKLETDSIFWSAMYLVFGTVGLLAIPIRSYLFAIAGAKLIRRIRLMTFQKVVNMEIAWFDQIENSSGIISARLSTDAATLRSLVGDALALLVQNISTLVCSLAVAFVATWQLSLLILPLVPIIYLNGIVRMKYNKGFSASAEKKYQEASQVANDALGSMRTIASFSAEEKVMELYEKKCQGPIKEGIRKGVLSGISYGVSYLLVFCVYAAIFYAGSRLVGHDKITFDKIFQAFAAIAVATLEISQSSSSVPDSNKAKLVTGSIFSILDRKSQIDPSDETGMTLNMIEGNIEFRHVSFKYPSRPNVQIFQDICFAIPSGKTIAFTGESGSGKSTVISLLQRFYDPDSGHILLDGIELRKFQLNWLRKQMGLVSQEPILFNNTIRSNIAYGKEDTVSEAEIVAAAELANAHKFISSLNQGYETIVGERGIQLSGGQKQRVAIARAIVKQPKVLLLDEATSALDSASERIVQTALEQAMVNRTTIVVAHRLTTIKSADLIAVIKNGLIVEKGKHDDLINIKDGWVVGGMTMNPIKIQWFCRAGSSWSLVYLVKEGSRPNLTEGSLSTTMGCVVQWYLIDLGWWSGRTTGLEVVVRQNVEPSGGGPAVVWQNSDDIIAPTSWNSISTNAEGNGSEIKQDARDGKKEDQETKVVPIYKLFSFSDSTDIILMTLGTAGALANGATMPLLTVIMGSLINTFGEDPDIDQVVHRVSKVHEAFFQSLSCLNFKLPVSCWMVTGERQAARIRNSYLKALLKQEIAFFDKEGNTGEIVSRISGDTVLIQDAMGEKVGKFIGQTSTFFTAFIIAFAQGWLLTLAMISVIPIIGLCSVIISKAIIKTASIGQNANAETSIIVQQTISSIRTVASFTGENLSVKIFEKTLKNAYKSSINEGIVAGFGSGILTFLSYCALSLGFWYGGKLILQRGYHGGKVISIIFAVLFGSSSLAQVSPCMAAFAAGQAAAYKMFETINRKPEIDATDPTGKRLDVILGSIEFKDVHFSYPSRPEQKIFTGLSLFIHHGITVALVGGSGSGKSTVVSLIERFYDPQDGVVLIDGINIKQFQLRWLREKIGLVSQEPILFGSTIGDNITYGKNNATIEEIKAATELANASKFINMMPQGLDTMVGEQGTQLSGGQKQRIAIARAILKDPRILLLDEATSALDVESERVVQEALDRVMINRTTVIIAHRLSTVKTADTIAVMHQGSIVEQGSHIELQKNPMGAYSQFIQLQEMDQSLNQSSHAHQVEAILPAIEASSLSRNSSLERSIRRESSLRYVSGHLFFTEPALPVAINWQESPSGEPKADIRSKKSKKESIRRLAHINKPEALILLLGSVAAFFNGVLYPAYAILISTMIRTFYEPPHKLKKDSIFWSTMYLVFGAVGLVAIPIRSYLFAIAGAKLIRRIRLMTFQKVVNMEIAWFDQIENSSGAISARLSTDAAALRSLVGDALALLVQNISTLVCGLAVAFVASWQLSLIILALVPIISLNGIFRMKFNKGFSANAEKMYEEASQVANDALGSMRTIASFSAEEKVMELYKKKCKGPIKAGIKQGILSGITYGVSYLLVFCVYAAIFYAGSRLVGVGKITFDKVFQAFLAIAVATLEIAQSSSNRPDSNKAKRVMGSIFAILDRQSRIDPSDESGMILNMIEGNIEFRHVSFKYPSRPNVQIFRDICFAIQSGKTIAFVGESGSGKSTAIALLQRFYDPDSGHILLDGIELQKFQLSWLRKQMGLVSQEPMLFNNTIQFNIAYGKEDKASEAEIIVAAELANAHNFISSLNQGYETIVGERGIQLSGGQKQRLAIARAIVKQPKVLLLDEATSALDSESERIVQTALEQIMVNRTTVIVAHRLTTIKSADLIAVIKDGMIVEQGKHDALLNIKDGVYASLVAIHSTSSS
ncbi:hypothetical protein M5K25_014641 [Dendrobium thyrsiflorum]|uniref:Uncharacterized protein n=1 Tax=Dendrobium thyrsiflorum TaxID=117978 RepID=A0ABD0UNI9_DENTH